MKLSRLLLFLSGFTSLTASAFEPFEVKDIRVEGIQRTEAGHRLQLSAGHASARP